MNPATIPEDLTYLTGQPTAGLLSGAMTIQQMPRLNRAVVDRHRADIERASLPVYSGFIAPEDKQTLTSTGGLNAEDVPDNLTEALRWRGKKYLNRRYLTSLFFRWLLWVMLAYAIIEATNSVSASNEVNNPLEALLALGSIATSLIGLVGYLAIYIATAAYGFRLGTLLVQKRLTEGAQYWLAHGSPLDPIRRWTRRGMLSIERSYSDTNIVGQTAFVVFTDHTGAIVPDPRVYDAATTAMNRLTPSRGGALSSDDRLTLISHNVPTVIGAGYSAPQTNDKGQHMGAHMVMYVIGVTAYSLAQLENQLYDQYISNVLQAVQHVNPHVTDARMYFTTDPQIYNSVINGSDTRRKWFTQSR